MVGTILPIVYGERRCGRWPVVLGLHVLGYIGGASGLGALLGGIGAVFSGPVTLMGQSHFALVLTGLISLVYSIRELDLAPVPALQFRQQVPSKWRLLLSPKVMALSYGLGLGCGLATRIPVSTFYVSIVWAVLSASPIRGALVMAAFGLGRALPLVWMSGQLESVTQCRRLARILPGWESVVHLVNGLALAFSGSCLLVARLVLR